MKLALSLRVRLNVTRRIWNLLELHAVNHVMSEETREDLLRKGIKTWQPWLLSARRAPSSLFLPSRILLVFLSLCSFLLSRRPRGRESPRAATPRWIRRARGSFRSRIRGRPRAG